jgi:hypothetical protein
VDHHCHTGLVLVTGFRSSLHASGIVFVISLRLDRTCDLEGCFEGILDTLDPLSVSSNDRAILIQPEPSFHWQDGVKPIR